MDNGTEMVASGQPDPLDLILAALQAMALITVFVAAHHLLFVTFG